jgi:hypothetical protein
MSIYAAKHTKLGHVFYNRIMITLKLLNANCPGQIMNVALKLPSPFLQ